MSGEAKISELKSLQMLRAVASASVVYCHTDCLPGFGTFGVDIFFVISGFVMAMIAAGGPSPRDFALKRIIRIAPLYWLLTSALLGVAVFRPELLHSTSADIGHYFKSIFFIPYFKENGTLNPMLPVGWSLNYEMFFYLCVGVGLVASRRNFALVTAGLIFAAYGFGQAPGYKVAHEFFGQAFMFEFLLGMAAFAAWRGNWLGGARNGLLIAAAMAAYVFMAFEEMAHSGVDRLALYGIPAFMLVLCVVQLEDYCRTKSKRGVAFVVAIGDASYATYLSHLYVVEGSRKIFSQQSWLNPVHPLGAAMAVVMALAVGQVIYMFIDAPVNGWLKARLRRKRGPAVAATAGARP